MICKVKHCPKLKIAEMFSCRGMIPRILIIIPVTENSEVLFIHPGITPVYITNTFYCKGSW